MIQHQGIWLPDREQHLIQWMTRNGEMVDEKGTYQIKKFREAVGCCRNFRTAVDVGGHVGLWSMQMDKVFYSVHAFEPVAEHRECFKKNLKTLELAVGDEDSIAYDSEWVRLHACALGDHEGTVSMKTPEINSTGSTMIDGEGDIPLRTLDSFQLNDVDFIKIDCEGYEYNVLKGAQLLIRNSRPVIIVEQKPGRAQRFGFGEKDSVDYLREHFGYRLHLEMSGDFIMVPG